jgi:hypothetical protein
MLIRTSLVAALFCCAALAASSNQESMPAELKSVLDDARYGIQKGTAGLRADNDANGFSVRFSGAETSIDLPGSDAGARATLALEGYGWGANWEFIGPVTGLQASGKRLDRYYGSSLTEWFVNSPQGLEHGFVVARRANDADGYLRLQIAVAGGWKASGAGDRIRLRRADVTLDYAGLQAWDATGNVLSSRLRGTGDGIEIEVDDTSAVYPLTLDPMLTQQQKLTASDAANFDNSGYSVALSSDGNTALVGACNKNSGSGAAYVFTRSDAIWTQQQELTASDAAYFDNLGCSVALSGDGNAALVGAYNKNSASGAAYVFTRSGGTWTQQQELTASDAANSDYFGHSVGLSRDGNTALAGAFGKNLARGAAYVFARSGANWAQQQQLTASVPANFDFFGWSVALSGDGNTVLAGAPRKNSYTGAAYVLTRSGGTWTQQQELTASDSAVSDYFGYSGALSGDGNTAMAGAPNKNTAQGAAYTYTSNVCNAGFYSLTGNTPCTPAPVGSYVSSAGATAATSCSAGSFSSTAGQTSCTPAPAGSFVAIGGATAATPCPAGSFSSAPGQTSCRPAPAGSFVAIGGATAATPCPTGTFSSTAGQSSCTPAPAGSFVASGGATAATPCPAGSFSSAPGQTSCRPAPVGSFVANAGATAATPCAAGSSSSTAGQTSCTPAPPGSFVPNAGATAATLCPPRTFSSTAGQTSCTPGSGG